MLEYSSQEADIAACGELLRAGSKSFRAASMLLPERVRTPATVIYAFCRIADDLVDQPGATHEALEVLSDRLRRAYAGQPHPHPVDRAFSEVVRGYDIPYPVFEALLSGFAWDLEGKHYRTFEDVIDYSIRVAGTVGIAMSMVMGQRAPEVLSCACELGIAMQLTNIARDVGEDARRGRVYLPLDWLDPMLSEELRLARAPASDGLRRVVLRLLDVADQYYQRSAVGVGSLPGDCRPAIRAAAAIYRAIGSEVRREGGDSIGRRAVVPRMQKLWLIGKSLLPTQSEAQELPIPMEHEGFTRIFSAGP